MANDYNRPNEFDRPNEIEQSSDRNLEPTPNKDNKHAKKVGDGTMSFMLWSIAGTVIAACSSPIFSDVADLTGGGGGGDTQGGPDGNAVTNGRWANTMIYLADENGARVSGPAVGYSDGAGNIILNNGMPPVVDQRYIADLQGAIEISTGRLGGSGEELLSLPYVSGEALIISPLTDLLARALNDAIADNSFDPATDDSAEFYQDTLNDIFGERPQFDTAGAAMVDGEGEFVNSTPQVTLADVLDADNYNAFVADDTVTRSVSLASNEIGMNPGTGSVGDLITLFGNARTSVESVADETMLETQLDAQLVLIKQDVDVRSGRTAVSRPVAANPNEGDPISIPEDQNFTVVRGNAETLFGFEDPFGNAGADGADGARVDGEFEGLYIEAASMGGDVDVMFRNAEGNMVALASASEADRGVVASAPAMTTVGGVRFYYVSEANFGQLVLMPDPDFNTASITDEDSLPQIRFYVYDGEHATVDNGGSLNGVGTLKIAVVAANDAPTAITADTTTITYSGNTPPAGTLVATLSTTDVDAGDTHTYAITGGTHRTSFMIVDNELRFADQGAVNVSPNDDWSVVITSRDSNGATFTEDFTITRGSLGVTPPGETDLVFSGGELLPEEYNPEDNSGLVSGTVTREASRTWNVLVGDTDTETSTASRAGLLLGTLSDGGQSTRFEVVYGSGDDHLFAVDGNDQLYYIGGAIGDADAAHDDASNILRHEITVRGFDADGALVENYTYVTNVENDPADNPPVINTSASNFAGTITDATGTGTFTASGSLVATDNATDDTITWTPRLTGTDYGDVTFSSTTGDTTTWTFTLNATGLAALRALGAGDTLTTTFEITARDDDGDDDETLTITLQGVNDAPSEVTLSSLVASYAGTRPTADVLIGTLGSVDVDSTTFTYSITAGASDFRIDGDQLYLLATAAERAVGGMWDVSITSSDGTATVSGNFPITRGGLGVTPSGQDTVYSRGEGLLPEEYNPETNTGLVSGDPAALTRVESGTWNVLVAGRDTSVTGRDGLLLGTLSDDQSASFEVLYPAGSAPANYLFAVLNDNQLYYIGGAIGDADADASGTNILSHTVMVRGLNAQGGTVEDHTYVVNVANDPADNPPEIAGGASVSVPAGTNSGTLMATDDAGQTIAWTSSGSTSYGDFSITDAASHTTGWTFVPNEAVIHGALARNPNAVLTTIITITATDGDGNADTQILTITHDTTSIQIPASSGFSLTGPAAATANTLTLGGITFESTVEGASSAAGVPVITLRVVEDSNLALTAPTAVVEGLGTGNIMITITAAVGTPWLDVQNTAFGNLASSGFNPSADFSFDGTPTGNIGSSDFGVHILTGGTGAPDTLQVGALLFTSILAGQGGLNDVPQVSVELRVGAAVSVTVTDSDSDGSNDTITIEAPADTPWSDILEAVNDDADARDLAVASAHPDSLDNTGVLPSTSLFTVVDQTIETQATSNELTLGGLSLTAETPGPVGTGVPGIETRLQIGAALGVAVSGTDTDATRIITITAPIGTSWADISVAINNHNVASGLVTAAVETAGSFGFADANYEVKPTPDVLHKDTVSPLIYTSKVLGDGDASTADNIPNIAIVVTRDTTSTVTGGNETVRVRTGVGVDPTNDVLGTTYIDVTISLGGSGQTVWNNIADAIENHAPTDGSMSANDLVSIERQVRDDLPLSRFITGDGSDAGGILTGGSAGDEVKPSVPNTLSFGADDELLLSAVNFGDSASSAIDNVPEIQIRLVSGDAEGIEPYEIPSAESVLIIITIVAGTTTWGDLRTLINTDPGIAEVRAPLSTYIQAELPDASDAGSVITLDDTNFAPIDTDSKSTATLGVPTVSSGVETTYSEVLVLTAIEPGAHDFSATDDVPRIVINFVSNDGEDVLVTLTNNSDEVKEITISLPSSGQVSDQGTGDPRDLMWSDVETALNANDDITGDGDTITGFLAVSLVGTDVPITSSHISALMSGNFTLTGGVGPIDPSAGASSLYAPADATLTGGRDEAPYAPADTTLTGGSAPDVVAMQLDGGVDAPGEARNSGSAILPEEYNPQDNTGLVSGSTDALTRADPRTWNVLVGDTDTPVASRAGLLLGTITTTDSSESFDVVYQTGDSHLFAVVENQLYYIGGAIGDADMEHDVGNILTHILTVRGYDSSDAPVRDYTYVVHVENDPADNPPMINTNDSDLAGTIMDATGTGTFTATGSLVATDNATDDTITWTPRLTGTDYGDVEFSSTTGDTTTWTFTLNATGLAALRALGANDTLTTTFEITARDEDGDDDETLTITLQGVNDAPTAITADASAIAYSGNTPPAGMVVATLSTTDVDTSDTHTYTITGGTHGMPGTSSFRIVGNELRFADQGAVNLDPGNEWSVQITSRDSSGATFVRDFTFTRGNFGVTPSGATDPVFSGGEGLLPEEYNPVDDSGLVGGGSIDDAGFTRTASQTWEVSTLTPAVEMAIPFTPDMRDIGPLRFIAQNPGLSAPAGDDIPSVNLVIQFNSNITAEDEATIDVVGTDDFPVISILLHETSSGSDTALVSWNDIRTLITNHPAASDLVSVEAIGTADELGTILTLAALNQQSGLLSGGTAGAGASLIVSTPDTITIGENGELVLTSEIPGDSSTAGDTIPRVSVRLVIGDPLSVVDGTPDDDGNVEVVITATDTTTWQQLENFINTGNIATTTGGSPESEYISAAVVVDASAGDTIVPADRPLSNDFVAATADTITIGENDELALTSKILGDSSTASDAIPQVSVSLVIGAALDVDDGTPDADGNVEVTITATATTTWQQLENFINTGDIATTTGGSPESAYISAEVVVDAADDDMIVGPATTNATANTASIGVNDELLLTANVQGATSAMGVAGTDAIEARLVIGTTDDGQPAVEVTGGPVDMFVLRQAGIVAGGGFAFNDDNQLIFTSENEDETIAVQITRDAGHTGGPSVSVSGAGTDTSPRLITITLASAQNATTSSFDAILTAVNTHTDSNGPNAGDFVSVTHHPDSVAASRENSVYVGSALTLPATNLERDPADTTPHIITVTAPDGTTWSAIESAINSDSEASGLVTASVPDTAHDTQAIEAGDQVGITVTEVATANTLTLTQDGADVLTFTAKRAGSSDSDDVPTIIIEEVQQLTGLQSIVIVAPVVSPDGSQITIGITTQADTPWASIVERLERNTILNELVEVSGVATGTVGTVAIEGEGTLSGGTGAPDTVTVYDPDGVAQLRLIANTGGGNLDENDNAPHIIYNVIDDADLGRGITVDDSTTGTVIITSNVNLNSGALSWAALGASFSPTANNDIADRGLNIQAELLTNGSDLVTEPFSVELSGDIPAAVLTGGTGAVTDRGDATNGAEVLAGGTDAPDQATVYDADGVAQIRLIANDGVSDDITFELVTGNALAENIDTTTTPGTVAITLSYIAGQLAISNWHAIANQINSIPTITAYLRAENVEARASDAPPAELFSVELSNTPPAAPLTGGAGTPDVLTLEDNNDAAQLVFTSRIAGDNAEAGVPEIGVALAIGSTLGVAVTGTGADTDPYVITITAPAGTAWSAIRDAVNNHDDPNGPNAGDLVSVVGADGADLTDTIVAADATPGTPATPDSVTLGGEYVRFIDNTADAENRELRVEIVELAEGDTTIKDLNDADVTVTPGTPVLILDTSDTNFVTLFIHILHGGVSNWNDIAAGGLENLGAPNLSPNYGDFFMHEIPGSAEGIPMAGRHTLTGGTDAMVVPEMLTGGTNAQDLVIAVPVAVEMVTAQETASLHGLLVGTLSDGGQSTSFEVLYPVGSDADDYLFAVGGAGNDQLYYIGGTIGDADADASGTNILMHEITVRGTANNGDTEDYTYVVNVADVLADNPPEIDTSASNFAGTITDDPATATFTATGNLVATDPTGDDITWTAPLASGSTDYGDVTFADAAESTTTWTFTLNGAGRAALRALGRDGTLTTTFDIIATDDDGGTDTEPLTITLQGENNAPSEVTLDNLVAGYAGAGNVSPTADVLIGTLGSVDVDSSAGFIYRIRVGAGDFRIQGDQLYLLETADGRAPGGEWSVSITSRDDTNHSSTAQLFTITRGDLRVTPTGEDAVFSGAEGLLDRNFDVAGATENDGMDNNPIITAEQLWDARVLTTPAATQEVAFTPNTALFGEHGQLLVTTTAMGTFGDTADPDVLLVEIQLNTVSALGSEPGFNVQSSDSLHLIDINIAEDNTVTTWNDLVRLINTHDVLGTIVEATLTDRGFGDDLITIDDNSAPPDTHDELDFGPLHITAREAGELTDAITIGFATTRGLLDVAVSDEAIVIVIPSGGATWQQIFDTLYNNLDVMRLIDVEITGDLTEQVSDSQLADFPETTELDGGLNGIDGDGANLDGGEGFSLILTRPDTGRVSELLLTAVEGGDGNHSLDDAIPTIMVTLALGGAGGTGAVIADPDTTTTPGTTIIAITAEAGTTWGDIVTAINEDPTDRFDDIVTARTVITAGAAVAGSVTLEGGTGTPDDATLDDNEDGPILVFSSRIAGNNEADDVPKIQVALAIGSTLGVAVTGTGADTTPYVITITAPVGTAWDAIRDAVNDHVDPNGIDAGDLVSVVGADGANLAALIAAPNATGTPIILDGGTNAQDEVIAIPSGADDVIEDSRQVAKGLFIGELSDAGGSVNFEVIYDEADPSQNEDHEQVFVVIADGSGDLNQLYFIGDNTGSHNSDDNPNTPDYLLTVRGYDDSNVFTQEYEYAVNIEPHLAVSSEGVRESIVISGVEFRALVARPMSNNTIRFRDDGRNDITSSSGTIGINTRDFSQAGIAGFWNTDTSSNSNYVATIIEEMSSIDMHADWPEGGFTGGSTAADREVTKGSDFTASGWLKVTGGTGDVTFGGTMTGELGGTSGTAAHTDTREYTYTSTYGDLVIDGDGDWVYTLGGTTDQNSAVMALTSTIMETFIVEVSRGDEMENLDIEITVNAIDII